MGVSKEKTIKLGNSCKVYEKIEEKKKEQVFRLAPTD